MKKGIHHLHLVNICISRDHSIKHFEIKGSGLDSLGKIGFMQWA